MTTMLTDEEWEKIRRAVTGVIQGWSVRVDGPGWKVYRAGTIVRIDIHISTQETENENEKEKETKIA